MTTSADKFKRPRPGDPIEAAQWNLILEFITALKSSMPTGFVGPGGFFARRQTKRPVTYRLAVITDVGPKLEDDYGDERYWFEFADITNDAGDEHDAIGILALDPGSAEALHSTATNLAEWQAGTHEVEDGTPVVVFWSDDKKPAYNRHYYFWHPADTTHMFWARITDSDVYDEPAQNRWTYDWERVEKTEEGYGGWTPTGESGEANGYNTNEDMNDVTGVQGNGVDVANLDTPEYTFEIQPAPPGVIVRMRVQESPSSGSESVVDEYWFTYENGVDGTCDAGSS